MPAFKNQHFVPELYLRLFANSDGKSISLFNIISRHFVTAGSISDQASKDWFYGKDTLVEQDLSRIEGIVAPIIQSLAAGGRIPKPRHDRRYALGIFVLLMRERTAANKADLKFTTDRLGKAMLRRSVKEPELLAQVDQILIDTDGDVVDAMNQAMAFGPMLWDLKWKIFESQCSHAFITSDAPVVLHNQWFESVETTSALGYATMGLQVFLPLGPKRLLMMYDDTTYSVGFPASNLVILRNSEHVEAINALQWEGADKVIYVSPNTTIDNLLASADRYQHLRRGQRVTVDEARTQPLPNGMQHVATYMRLPPMSRLNLPQIKLLRAPPSIIDPVQGLPVRNAAWAAKVHQMGDRLRNREIAGDQFIQLLTSEPIPKPSWNPQVR